MEVPPKPPLLPTAWEYGGRHRSSTMEPVTCLGKTLMKGFIYALNPAPCFRNHSVLQRRLSHHRGFRFLEISKAGSPGMEILTCGTA